MDHHLTYVKNMCIWKGKDWWQNDAILFGAGDDTIAIPVKDLGGIEMAARLLARKFAELAGEKLACDLTEEEAKDLYQKTSW